MQFGSLKGCKHHEISKFIVYVPSLELKNGKLENHGAK